MTMTDPFAPTAEPEEAQQQEVAEAKPQAIATAYVDVKPRLEGFPVSDGKVVLTFKGGSGYDAPWIVVHAADLDEALEHVTTKAETLISVMERVQLAGKHFAGLAPAKASSNNINVAPARPLQPSQPSGSVEAPSWAPPKPFDDFVYVTKVKAETGKVWHAWMPPEKGDTRQPKFFFPPR